MFGFWVKLGFGLAVVGYGYYRLYFRDIKNLPRDMIKDKIVRTVLSAPFIAIPLALIIAVLIPLYYLEPYKGRVIEAGTGEPIEGAAVLVVYKVNYPSPVGDMTEYVDARETSTDKNGKYRIWGRWKIGMQLTPYGDLNIFKPGYEYAGGVYSHFLQDWWHAEFARILNPGYEVFTLKKLTDRTKIRENMLSASPGLSLPDEKMKYYRKQLNIEMERLYGQKD